MSDSLRPHELHAPWNSTGQNTGVGSLFLLQGIFPTQGLNPGLPHCGQILYQVSHQGSASSPIIRLIIREYSRSREKSPKLILSPPECKFSQVVCLAKKKEKICQIDLFNRDTYGVSFGNVLSSSLAIICFSLFHSDLA